MCNTIVASVDSVVVVVDDDDGGILYITLRRRHTSSSSPTIPFPLDEKINNGIHSHMSSNTCDRLSPCVCVCTVPSVVRVRNNEATKWWSKMKQNVKDTHNKTRRERPREEKRQHGSAVLACFNSIFAMRQFLHVSHRWIFTIAEHMAEVAVVVSANRMPTTL